MVAGPSGVEQAWERYAAGDLEGAAALARQVVDATALPGASAALGFFLLESGRLDEAQRTLLPALQISPGHAPLHWYAGYLHRRLGDTEAAARAFLRACELDPGLDEAAYALAWALHDLGRIEEASIWSAHARARSATPERLEQAAWLLLKQDRLTEAAAAYRQAIAALPPSAVQQPRLHLHLAQCLARQGHDREAASLLDDARQRWPGDFELAIEAVWKQRHRGDRDGALLAARELSAAHPKQARAWHIEGLLAQEAGDLEGADRALELCQQLDADVTDALWRRAEIQYGWRRYEGTRWLLGLLLDRSPRDTAALALLAQVQMDEGRHDEARRLLVPRLRNGIASPALWRLLALAHAGQERPRRAARILQRLVARDPGDAEALRALGWLALDLGDTGAAVRAARASLQLMPGDVRVQVQAVFAFLRHGDVAQAQRWAEQAVAQAPGQSAAWRALGQLRLQQQRLDEAQEAAAEALRLAPQDVDASRLVAAVLMTSARYGQAQLVLLGMLDAEPREPWVLLLDLSAAQRGAGQLDDAVASVDEALARRPGWFPALLLRARLFIEAGHPQALAACEHLLRTDRRSPDAARMLLRLVGLGNEGARRFLPLVPADVLRSQWKVAVTEAVHTQSQAVLERLAQLGCEELDCEPWMQWAALYAASLACGSHATGLARRARDAFRALKLRAGLAAQPMRPREAGARPRIAYVAGQLHQSLIAPVLAAHDPDGADVFLFTNHPPGGLPANVRVQALNPDTLAASCAASCIDVLIDAGGLHPVEGQFEVLRAFAQRIAPTQLGWLGCWGSTGGLFDAVLADEVSVPAAHAINHDEEVLRLEGGAWCWQPPAWAPEPVPPPSLASGAVTFGVSSRSLKLDAACLDAFARTVAAVPQSSIRFIGEIAGDWPLRRDVLRRMLAAGVAPDRVFFDPFVPRAEYLRWCTRIDILLDSFPGNGGLSLLDPLWMGMPVVTLAGGWAGARQGASLLHAFGAAEWVAASEHDFCAKAVALAADTQGLARLRASLRARMRNSPLLDGRRLAAQIETLARRFQHEASQEAQAPHPKDRVRAHARRMLDAWLALPRMLDLPVAPVSTQPDLSVIVVLYEQAGLSLRTLQALADQEGVRFETIVVDNASGDRTPQLLERLRGATVLRNPTNAGFLRAARQGAQAARGRYLVFLNSDAILQEGALRETLRLLRADPGIGALGGRVVLTTGGLQEAGNLLFRDGSAGGIGRGEDPSHHAALAARDTDYVSGVFLATPAPVWRLLDGFDEGFAPAYYEDTDYCLRVWRAGFRVAYAPAVLLEHLEWGSATGASATALMDRNRELFRSRHGELLRDRPRPGALPLDGDRWRSPDDRPRRPRVLVLDNEVPHDFKGGGLPRARWMLRALDGWPVTLFPLWEPHDHVRAVYASLPESVEVALGHGIGGLEAFLEKRRSIYDVLLVSRPPNLALLAPLRRRRPDLFAGVRLVYDAEALFALREIAMAGVRGRPLTAHARRERIAAEVALADGATDVLVVSQRDARHFEAAGHRTHILSHGITTRRHAPGPQGRAGLLFVGALHPDTPNEDGMLWFMREVMPLLRQHLGRAPEVRVVGVCLSSRVAAMADEGVLILGPQLELEPHYDAARVFIAPVRFAGGVPAKVIEAAAAGIPVVASALLVRQLDWREGVDILGARDARSFAAAVARLLLDDAAWQRQQQAAWEQCALRYDPQLFGDTLRGVLEEAARS